MWTGSVSRMTEVICIKSYGIGVSFNFEIGKTYKCYYHVYSSQKDHHFWLLGCLTTSTKHYSYVYFYYKGEELHNIFDDKRFNEYFITVEKYRDNKIKKVLGKENIFKRILNFKIT
jgi:hypothetical protein